MTEPPDLPKPDEILAIHKEIEKEYAMKYTGTRVAAPRLNLRDIRREVGEYDDLYMRAACLLRKLITAHLFEDGNKRTAWTVTTTYLERAGAKRAESSVGTERVVRSIRKYEVDELAEWLKTGGIDQSRLNPPRRNNDK